MATRWCSLQLRCAAGSAGGKALHRGQRAAVGARVLPLSLRRLSGGGWRQPRPPPPRAQQQPNQTDQQDADLDPIERLVGKLFGRKALEDPTPGGLKRLSDEAAKELYPATVDQWADPLPGDSEDVAVLRQLLAQTQLEAAPLRLAFDADRDGWSADAFHAGVDGFGACLVVAETEGGALVGGYNARGWISLGEDRDSIASFLFCWRDGDFLLRPVKLPKVGGAALAVVKDAPGSGIWFGPDGLHIPLVPGAEQAAKCKLGPYYARLPDGGKSLFAASESGRGTQLVGLRAYVREGKGEEWQLDGIVWSTTTGSS